MSRIFKAGHLVAIVISLGVTLYEMLAGTRPFDEDSLEVFVSQGVGSPRPMRSVNPVNPVPAELNDLIESMLSAEREDRPESMMAVMAALRSF